MWPIGLAPGARLDGRLLGSTRRRRAPSVATEFDPMYGPAVRRKRFHRSGGFAVLHQCIRPLIGAVCAPGHHGYQRACVLITGQASSGAIWVTRVRMRREDRSSISFHPLADLGRKTGTMSSLSPDRCSSFVRAVSVPSSRPARIAGHRAQGPSRLAVALSSPQRRRFQATP
jgi:hypothetical protein